MPRYVGSLSVIVLLLVVVALYALKPQPVVALRLIFPTLTIAFLTSTSLAIAYVALKGYSREGLVSVLLLGCGTLVLGTTALAASLGFETIGRNFSATVLALGAATSGGFHLACASKTYRGDAPERVRGRAAPLLLSVAALAVALILVVALGGFLPLFNSVSGGTTTLDQSVLVASALAFLCSVVLMSAVYASSRSSVIFWYAAALAASAVGILGVAISSGDLASLAMRVGWAVLYLGGVLMLDSVLSAETGRASRAGGTRPPPRTAG